MRPYNQMGARRRTVSTLASWTMPMDSTGHQTHSEQVSSHGHGSAPVKDADGKRRQTTISHVAVDAPKGQTRCPPFFDENAIGILGRTSKAWIGFSSATPVAIVPGAGGAAAPSASTYAR